MSRIPRGDCVDSFTTTATCEGTTIMRSFHLAHGFFLLLCWSGSCNAVAGWRTAATPIASVQHRERSLGSAWPHARQQRRCASGREQRETRRERHAERDRERERENGPEHHCASYITILFAEGVGALSCVCLCESPTQLALATPSTRVSCWCPDCCRAVASSMWLRMLLLDNR